MATYRERREARAERLRGWAGKRQRDAAATLKADERFTDDHAFNTQPGHIPERARVIARENRAFASIDKANAMSSRADEIERQAANAIYDDDPDAIERLTEKIDKLERERERRKHLNNEYRREHKAELATMTAYERNQAVPYPSYSITNMSGNISRLRDRLKRLQAASRPKPKGLI